MDIQRNTIKRIWTKYKWFILAVLWLASLLLGYSGFAAYGRANGLNFTPTEILYRTLQLISMDSGAVEGENNWMLEVGRLALPGLTAITALEALAAIFREQTVWLRLWRRKDHVIVCGLGRKGRFLLDDLLANGHQVVVIEKQVNPVIADEYRRRGAVILEGDAANPELLENARINRAKYLICLMGDDALNLQVAFLSAHLVNDNPRHRLTCHVQLSSQDLMEVVRASERSLGAGSNVSLDVFNVYDSSARRLLQDDPVLRDQSLSRRKSVMICGLGGFGKSLIRQLAYTFYRSKSSGKLDIILLDREADLRLEELRMDCPGLDSVCQFKAVNLDLSSSHGLRKQLADLMKKKSLAEVFICTGNPVVNLQAFLVIDNLVSGLAVPIRTRMDKSSGLTYLVEDVNTGQFFDIYQQTCTHDLVIGGMHELLARQLREHYLKGLGPVEGQGQIAIPWETVEESEKEANHAQAGRIVRILRENGYRISPLEDWDAADRILPAEAVERMAEMEHQLWCEWKKEKGWRYAEDYDSARKTNPDLVAWEVLPEGERGKNRHFINSLPEILAEIGLQIDR